VFLDEPTSGVDPISRRQFWELIHQMAGEGVTVFVTTHYMDEAEYCNRLVLIDRGRIVAMGTPTELKRGSMKGELLLVECEPQGPGLEALRTAPVTAKAVRDYSRVFFASASDEIPDKQGRITIPPALREYAALQRDCVVIGANTRLEIWDAEAWGVYLDRQEDAFSEASEEVLPGVL